VESRSTIPLEVVLSGLPNAVRLCRHAIRLSFIIITFDDRANAYFARQQVVERLREVDLPGGAQPAPRTPVDADRRNLSLSAQVRHLECEGSALDRDWVVERQLRLIPGVADIVSSAASSSSTRSTPPGESCAITR